MKHASKLVGMVGAVALAAGLTLTATGTASAADSCNYNDDLGVCNSYDPRGYDARVQIAPDGNINGDWVDFNLVCGSKRFGDRDSFQAYPGHNYTYTFAVGSQGSCVVWLYDRTTGAAWASPSVSR
ncbi:hypothetical protein [Kitasatospora sp. GP82]|uniref:hypothetical protein n=1 Tax=Kitasatospora sp. GP82 TaxID=3035089 RepID=UPI0024733B5C|nr:hypothetical protein [Kitasatospora sp. GP82]MDH6128529.1 hypothetical protein [Kitasatospora sp. GP82]